MFKFNFDVEDDGEQSAGSLDRNCATRNHRPASAPAVVPDVFTELSLADALDSLPQKISYSPITIPLVNGREFSLPRRDLFDARFQLISQHNVDDLDASEQLSNAHAQSALQFLDAPSDLVPLIYEGGLKTWECSLDLASYLDSISSWFDVHGKRVLEVGCGTSIPSLYILHRIFSSPPSPNQTHIHLQDYNASVLELVTVPNIILTWYLSVAGEPYRRLEEEPPDSTVFELNISDNLKDVFQQSLMTYGVNLRFFSGSWDTFDLQKSGGSYNLVMTSETIYRMESVPSLIAVMRGACNAEGPTEVDNCLCLVAAKVLYFGVGGGVAEFVRCVRDQDEGGTVETVWERTSGVERRVMSVKWK